MTITLTPVLAGTDTYIVDVSASTTDESSGNIVHGLGVVPKEVTVIPITADVATIPPWAATTIDATNVIITRDSTGAAASDCRVVIKAPHSIGS